MQTIKEYRAYTQQLEGDVGKWHEAYDALMVERNSMAATLCENKKAVKELETEIRQLKTEIRQLKGESR